MAGFPTLTMTLDRVMLHTAVHHSSTSTCTPNFIEIEETFCGRTDRRTDGRTFETDFIRSTLNSRPKYDDRLEYLGRTLFEKTSEAIKVKHIKLENGFRRPSIDVDAFAILTAYCDLDL